MELSLWNHTGMPEAALLSVRVGRVRRQGVVSGSCTFSFPKVTLRDNSMKIDVLRPIGVAYMVLKPGSANYKVDFTSEEGPMSCELHARQVEASKVAPPGKVAEKVAGKESDAGAAAGATKYLKEHQVLQFVESLLQAVVREQPEDPYDFMARQCLGGRRLPPGPAVAEAQPSEVQASRQEAADQGPFCCRCGCALPGLPEGPQDAAARAATDQTPLAVLGRLTAALWSATADPGSRPQPQAQEQGLWELAPGGFRFVVERAEAEQNPLVVFHRLQTALEGTGTTPDKLDDRCLHVMDMQGRELSPESLASPGALAFPLTVEYRPEPAAAPECREPARRSRCRATAALAARGTVEDRYDVEGPLLGDGSFATVLRATSKSTGAVRAVKVVPRAATGSGAVFTREIATMMALDHPNIVRLCEHFEDHRNIYLVTEFCEGGNLLDRVIDAGHLTEPQAATVMEQMLSVLCYMHGNHLCHRDVRPEHFHFQQRKAIDRDTLKLVDFGSSCICSPGQVLVTMSGSPCYVAPQVLAGKYDRACDTWSCGVVLYVLLCGYPPFHGATDLETTAKVRVGSFAFPPADWDSVSEDAKHLVRMLLQRNPRDRPTAERALRHEWIRGKAANASCFVDRLRDFRSQSKLREDALRIAAHQLDEHQIVELQQGFAALDGDGDGLLTAVELQQGLERAGLKEICPGMQQLLQGARSRGSFLDYTAFVAATLEKRRRVQDDLCWSAFRVFDANGDGKIAVENMSKVLDDARVQGAAGSEEALARLQRRAQQCSRGPVAFAEFMELLRGESTGAAAEDGAADEELGGKRGEEEGPPEADAQPAAEAGTVAAIT